MKPIDFPGPSGPPDAESVERSVTRALGYLRQAGARVTPAAGGYQLRIGADGRTRQAMRLDEAVFRRLAEEGALRPVDGGWALSRTSAPEGGVDRAGRPGVEEGERALMEPDGRLVSRRANLGESPIAWLARRRDGRGLRG